MSSAMTISVIYNSLKKEKFYMPVFLEFIVVAQQLLSMTDYGIKMVIRALLIIAASTVS